MYALRRPILARLARFDAKNAARRAEELSERRDRFAHYRRAVQTAEESLEEVPAISVPRTRAPANRSGVTCFSARHYETRNEAETARRTRAIQIAREFYAELDGGHDRAHRPGAPPRTAGADAGAARTRKNR